MKARFRVAGHPGANSDREPGRTACALPRSCACWGASAAASLREGLTEMFTVQRLGLSPNLARCLVSTNIIESPHSGVRLRTRRVCRWRDGKMVLRWAAAALLMTEKNFRKIMGYRDLWMLEAALGRQTSQGKVA